MNLASELGRIQRLYEEQLRLLDEDCVTRCSNRTALRERTADLLASAFIELATNLAPDLAVEIGAHEASFSARLKARVPGVHALAFEANPYVYEHFAPILRESATGVDYRFAAICDRDGVVELRIPVRLKRGDLLERSNPVSSIHYYDGWFAEYETVTVPAFRVDTAVGTLAAARAVTWIDAEGAQKEILDGGPVFFGHAAAVYIELESDPQYRGQLPCEAFTERLMGDSLVPVMRDNVARGQFNEVYIRPDREILEALMPTIVQYVEALRDLVAAKGSGT